MIATRQAVLRRYREIAAVLSRHGLGYWTAEVGLVRSLPFHRGLVGHPRRSDPYTRADHLRLALEELGPTFIKLGQILSTRPDLVPGDWAAELAKLQEQAPAVPWGQVEAKIERELGAAGRDLLAGIDPVPLAAASLAQVHRATLPSGEEVVVKVQRPGVRSQVKLDLAVLHGLARRAAAREAWRPYDPEALVAEFSSTIVAELDYMRERQNLTRFAKRLGNDAGVRVPRVYPALSGPKVLTLEFVGGFRVDDVAGLAGLAMDPAELARRLARLLFRSALEWGHFHADPHPGNFRVTPRGELVILDFGMMGRLGRAERHRILELVLAVVESDGRRATERLIDLGVEVSRRQATALEVDLGRLLAEYVEAPLGEIPMGDVLDQLLAIIRAHRLRLPTHLALFTKTILMAEGVGRQLDPGFRLAPLLKPLFWRALVDRFSPENVATGLRDAALDLLYLVEEGPASLRRVGGRLDRDELVLHARLEDRDLREELKSIAASLRLSGPVIAIVLALSLLMVVYHPPGWERWAGWVFGGLLIATLVLGAYLIGMARGDPPRRRPWR